MLNNIPFEPIPYEPRAIVQVNGINIKFTKVSIETGNFYDSDKFTLSFPLDGQGDILRLNYLSEATQFEVRIYVGYPKDSQQFTISNLTLVFVGEADNSYVEPASGLVMMTGRDLSGRLIDKKTTRQFSNYTASQLAILLANENNLTPVVTPTTTKLGTFYVLDQTLMARERSQWDLLVAAASAEGFVVYVEGDKLIFKPLPDEQSNPYVIYWQPATNAFSSPVSNAIKLTFERDMILAQGVKVVVRVPYNTQTGNAFTVSASTENSGRVRSKGLPAPNGKKQVYSYVKSGLTKDQALQFARNTLRNIGIHSVTAVATMIGDSTIKKDTVIKVQGTDSNYDSTYYVFHVLRTIVMNGFRMTMTLKNHPVNTTLVL